MFHDHVTKFVAAYNAHDAAAIAALIAPGGMHEGVPLNRVDTTPETIIAGLAPFFYAMPDVHWREDERLVAGKSVVVIYTMTGHLQNDLGALKAGGQAISIPGVFVLKFADGNLVAAQDFWDPAAFGRQVV